MYYLMFLFIGYVFLREYVESLSVYYTFIMDVFFMAIFLYSKVEYAIGNGRNGYLFKKETKVPWFLILTAFVFYVLRESIFNLYTLSQKLSSGTFQDYLFLGEQIIFVVVVTFMYIRTLFGDILELKLTHGYSFNISNFSKEGSSPSGEGEEDKEEVKIKGKKDEDVEIIREVEEEEEKEIIRKIPVIVITRE